MLGRGAPPPSRSTRPGGPPHVARAQEMKTPQASLVACICMLHPNRRAANLCRPGPFTARSSAAALPGTGDQLYRDANTMLIGTRRARNNRACGLHWIRLIMDRVDRALRSVRGGFCRPGWASAGREREGAVGRLADGRRG